MQTTTKVWYNLNDGWGRRYPASSQEMMTYLLFVNGTFFDSTRKNDLAFAWLREWRDKGHRAGLRFLRDNDEEALRWLVPEELFENQRMAA